MTRPRPRRRLPLVALLCVLAMLAAFALISPGGGTQAKWAGSQQMTLPAIGTGRIDLAVRPTAQGTDVEAGVANSSGFGLEYAPTQVRFAARSGSTTTAEDVNTFLNRGAGTSFAVHTATGCASTTTGARWSSPRVDNTTTGSLTTTASGTPAHEPLATGAADRPLCLGVRPDATTRDVLLTSAGREFQTTTTVQAATVAPGSWSTTVPWTSVHAVDLPTATARTGTNGASFTLGWAWPDTASSTDPTTTPAVNRWEVQMRSKTSATTGTWTAWSALGTVPGNRRNVTVTPPTSGSPWTTSTQFQFKIRAYPFAGTAKYVESSTMWQYTRSGTTYTRASTFPTNPTPGPVGYDALSLG